MVLTFCLRAGRACCGSTTPLWSTGEPVFFDFYVTLTLWLKSNWGIFLSTLNTGSTKSGSYLTDTFCSRGQQQVLDKPASVNVLIFLLALPGSAWVSNRRISVSSSNEATEALSHACHFCYPSERCVPKANQDQQLQQTAGCGNQLCGKNPQKAFYTVSSSYRMGKRQQFY